MGFIVVGIDGSETSRKAFHEAVREAQWRGASLLALHVVANPVMTGYEFGDLINVVLEGGKEFATGELKFLSETYDGAFPVVVDHSVVMGHAGMELLSAAEGDEASGPAELVVLGSRGLGGFKGLLLGSVTTYAAHHLECPLLIVPFKVD